MTNFSQNRSFANNNDEDEPLNFRHAVSSSSLASSEIDLSNRNLEILPENYRDENQFSHRYHADRVRSLILRKNRLDLTIFDQHLPLFARNLTFLDLSENFLEKLPRSLIFLRNLRVLIAKNNRLDSDCWPKNFDTNLTRLESLNLSGNLLDEFPDSIFNLKCLKSLLLGGNRITNVPSIISDMISLERLYLGGNQLTEIPATIGKLKNLISLTLSDNQLETIPSTVAHLRNLQTLSLHNNKLKTLPVELIKLENLQQLSLRSNPLVVRFVRDMSFDPPTLKELAGRTIKICKLGYTSPQDLLPGSLSLYLDSAHHCVNPKCKGVYFEAKVEHVKFVDFCGKYRLPLLQYLCSPKCSTAPAFAYTSASSDGSSSDTDAENVAVGGDDDQDGVPRSKMKKVLLG